MVVNKEKGSKEPENAEKNESGRTGAPWDESLGAWRSHESDQILILQNGSSR
ncbi:hypothetical protein [Algoriphagus boritolerans]|uniref:hypothetical protein n=1 Tax=Algoriphagus boritolerans TaxID=308111 RepID=UPI002FCE608A